MINWVDREGVSGMVEVEIFVRWGSDYFDIFIYFS